LVVIGSLFCDRYVPMQRLGKYEILEEIGRGGFATVYKARDTELDRLVALKVLHPYWGEDQSFVDRFRQEARAAARLRHPNIVTVHDAGEIQGQLYIAMEYLPGHTLRELLEVEGALTLDQALPILEQLARALDYAHGQEVVHRDVKPSNVMVEETADGVQVTLMDFGLVKALSGSTVLTSQGTLLGSPEYMAPEQADSSRKDEIGPASDRYALGVLAYHMLSGRVPFSGSTTAVLHAHVYEPPPDPQSIRGDISEEVAQALLKALAKEPEDRCQSGEELVEALREPVRISPPLGQALPWKWIVGIGAGLVVLALLVWGLSGGPGRTGQLTPTPTTLTVEASAPTATLSPVSTDTPLPTLSDTPEATPTPTPTPCALAPGDRFGTIWNAVQAKLGCPLNSAYSVYGAGQVFEHGYMLWRSDNQTIYVLFESGKASSFADTFQDGVDPEKADLSPPAGKQEPIRGFGKVWREEFGGASSDIGWAVEDEYVAPGLMVQDFVNGVVFWEDRVGNRVFYASGEWAQW
jgi:serine/threonine protein kinase